jgi:lauroyl/myristoyl acyltransferase
MSSIESNIAQDLATKRRFEVASARPDARYTSKAKAWGDFWMNRVMLPTVVRWPGTVRTVKPFFIEMTWRTSGYLRGSLIANARRILGDAAGASAHSAMGRAVLGNFYDSICEIASGSRISLSEMQDRIGEVSGRDRYLEIRSLKRGAILVTAHLGAFEAAVAALRRDEARVHIVFHRDALRRFEKLRAAQHQRLGITEAPVDDGLGAWIKLRDALLNDEVVLMQGDRVMPGQQGVRLPFFNGHMLFPSGPVKLARMTGAPLVPVFAPRLQGDRVKIILEERINVDVEIDDPSRPDEMLVGLARVIEKMVRDYPEQWLVLQRAFCEDQARTS